MKVLVFTLALLMSLISFSNSNNKDNDAKKRHDKRVKNMKLRSRGEHKQVLNWGHLYKKTQKQKQRIKKRMN